MIWVAKALTRQWQGTCELAGGTWEEGKQKEMENRVLEVWCMVCVFKQ